MTTVIALLAVWQGIWTLISVVGGAPEMLKFTPIGLPVWGVISGVEYIVEARSRRERQLEADYQECLRLIEWKPQELTPIQKLQEEIELQ